MGRDGKTERERREEERPRSRKETEATLRCGEKGKGRDKKYIVRDKRRAK